MNVTEAMAPSRHASDPPAPKTEPRPLPLSARKADIAILGFYWLNLLFITYIVDIAADPTPGLQQMTKSSA